MGGRGEADERLAVAGVVSQVALAAAELVVAEVAGDRVDPAAEVEALVDAVEGAEGLEEGLLGDVLGQQGVAQLAPDEAVDGADVAPVEGFERVHVARSVGGHQLEVGGLCDRLLGHRAAT